MRFLSQDSLPLCLALSPFACLGSEERKRKRKKKRENLAYIVQSVRTDMPIKFQINLRAHLIKFLKDQSCGLEISFVSI